MKGKECIFKTILSLFVLSLCICCAGTTNASAASSSKASYTTKKKDKSKTYNKKHKAEVYYNRVVLKGNSSAIKKINKSIKKDMNSFFSSANVENLYNYAKNNTTDTSNKFYLACYDL